jgi:hypothetical protein
MILAGLYERDIESMMACISLPFTVPVGTETTFPFPLLCIGFDAFMLILPLWLANQID